MPFIMQKGWNHRSIRMEGNYSPHQLFVHGYLTLQRSGLVALDFAEQIIVAMALIRKVSLTLGAHAQEGYGTCLVYVSVCVCVCVSVTILASTSFVSTFQIRYVQLSFRLYSIFNSWILDKTFRSKVMA